MSLPMDDDARGRSRFKGRNSRHESVNVCRVGTGASAGTGIGPVKTKDDTNGLD